MAKKSKTQRAKRSARRAEKKTEELVSSAEVEQTLAGESEKSANVKAVSADKKQALTAESSKEVKASQKSSPKKTKEKTAKSNRFQFFKDVRAELKRVTWPSRKDVTQWTGVVVAALLFFGIYTAVLDNLVVTPALYGVSSVDINGVTPQTEREIQNAQSSSDSSSDTSDDTSSADSTDSSTDTSSTTSDDSQVVTDQQLLSGDLGGGDARSNSTEGSETADNSASDDASSASESNEAGNSDSSEGVNNNG